MSHALTRKCAHFFVKLIEDGLEGLTSQEKETGICLLISLVSAFFTCLERAPPPKKHYSKQAATAPSRPTQKFSNTSFGNSTIDPKNPNYSKKGVPKKKPPVKPQNSMTFIPSNPDRTMFSVNTRYTKSGLTELTQAQMKSEDEQNLNKQARIRHESFGFF